MDPLPPGRTAQQLQQDKDHHDNRRVRELYRYFKPEQALAPPPNSSSYFDSWVSNNAIWTDEVPVPALSTASVSTPDPTVSSPVSTPATSTEGLMLGNPNHTLNSFAQLAALRLNVQRVLIRWDISLPGLVPFQRLIIITRLVSRIASHNLSWLSQRQLPT